MSDTPAPAPQPVTPARRWYTSLYWRVAVAFVGFLAVLLVAQALLFVWLARNTGGLFPATSNIRLAELVAADLRDALEDDPDADLDARIQAEYGRTAQRFVVVFSDGRTFSNRRIPPPGLAQNAARVLGRMREGRPARPRRQPAQGPRGGAFAPIVVEGTLVGIVAVPPGAAPLANVLQTLGPTMGLSGLVLLILGAGAAAVFVFRPVRHRLGELERAAQRLGAGDSSARAPEHGADEVAALARSFNRMAADLQARTNALVQADKARRQLLADVSHELMTPLTSMRGYVETLAMAELKLDTATRERYLRVVDEETRRLERLVGDLLDLARLEGGGGALRHAPVSVPALFERVRARHAREVTERRITLTTQVDAGAETVMGDDDRLEQVVQNLAANALRHVPDGGRLALDAARRGQTVHLTIRDNGPGIPDSHLPLIFDRFYKVDASRSGGGSGLGLSIVKGIVDAHGGTITARNEDGAVFEIVLPLESASRS